MYVVPTVLNPTFNVIVPLYFSYPSGAVSSTIVYVSVAEGFVIALLSAIVNIPSLPVWAPLFSVAPLTVNVAGFSVITVVPSFLVLITFTVYFPEYVISLTSDRGFVVYVFLIFNKFCVLPFVIISALILLPVKISLQ